MHLRTCGTLGGPFRFRNTQTQPRTLLCLERGRDNLFATESIRLSRRNFEKVVFVVCPQSGYLSACALSYELVCAKSAYPVLMLARAIIFAVLALIKTYKKVSFTWLFEAHNAHKVIWTAFHLDWIRTPHCEKPFETIKSS